MVRHGRGSGALRQGQLRSGKIGKARTEAGLATAWRGQSMSGGVRLGTDRGSVGHGKMR